MRYLNIILTVIAVALIFIAWKLVNLEAKFTVSSQNSQAIVGSNLALINSNQRLETSFNSLRQEIADFKAQLPKR